MDDHVQVTRAGSGASWSTALPLANQARVEEGNLRRQIRELDRADGAQLLAHMIQHEHPTVMKMRVERAIMTVKGVGANGARIIQRKAQVSVGATRVRDISPRQRGVIANELLILYTPGVDEL